MYGVKRSIYRGISILAGILFISLTNVCFAFSDDYIPTAIELLSGYNISRNLGINNLGEVVGRFYNYHNETQQPQDRQAFIWDTINGSSFLVTFGGESSAWGINDFGQASGHFYTAEGYKYAAFWYDEDTIVDIGALANPNTGVEGDSSIAYGINNFAKVVGNADIPNDSGDFIPFHAFIYDEINGLRDLGTLTSDWPQWQNGYSIAYDINNKNEAVGIAHGSSWAFLPFIYDETNGMRALLRDPNYINGEWYAIAINDSSRIGGHVIAAHSQSLPYYWENTSAAPIRITMPTGFPYGEIYGMNEPGQMVGMMWNSDREDAVEHAFIFDVEHGARDLNDLIDPTSGWILIFARDINDNGQIVGSGMFNGEKRGFILDLPDYIDKDHGDYTPLEGGFDNEDPAINHGAEEAPDVSQPSQGQPSPSWSSSTPFIFPGSLMLWGMPSIGIGYPLLNLGNVTSPGLLSPSRFTEGTHFGAINFGGAPGGISMLDSYAPNLSGYGGMAGFGPMSVLGTWGVTNPMPWSSHYFPPNFISPGLFGFNEIVSFRPLPLFGSYGVTFPLFNQGW